VRQIDKLPVRQFHLSKDNIKKKLIENEQYEKIMDNEQKTCYKI
jgi:hypothetical protein